MNILRYENSLDDIVKSPIPTIFLAGPTVRGNQSHLTSWRFEAIEEFAKIGFDGTLIVPEFSDKKETDKGKFWIPAWEFAGLSGCDIIMFWIPRTKELIGLTTNHEHGYWIAKYQSKCTYGHPEDSYRNEYLDLMWSFESKQSSRSINPIFASLPNLIVLSASLAQRTQGLNRIKSIIAVDSPYGAF